MNPNNNKAKGKLDIIVLMAGQGKRMGTLTDDKPKALLCMKDGNSIFSHIGRSFASLSLDPILIPVVGHGSHKVDEEMDKLKHEINFQKVYNPFYKTTGPLISLWLGLLVSKNRNLVIINGDTIINTLLAKEVEKWLDNNGSSKMLAGLCTSKTELFNKDDMKVALDQNNNFLEVGKHIEPDSTTLKSAGVFVVKGKEAKEILLEKVEEILKTENAFKTSYHWHNLVNEISTSYPVDLIQVVADSWCEMDTIEELQGQNIS